MHDKANNCQATEFEASSSLPSFDNFLFFFNWHRYGHILNNEVGITLEGPDAWTNGAWTWFMPGNK